VFSRRERASQTSAVPDSSTSAADGTPRPGAKGRPTPTRREAELERKARIKPNNSTKSIAKNARLRAMEERKEQRAGLMRGDERHLPKRDKGPMRAFIRDYVDARMSAAEFFLPLAAVVLLLSVTGAKALSVAVWEVMVIVLGVDSIILARRLRKELLKRFPQEPRRGTVPYSLMRALTHRRLRTPKPRVDRGTKV
jgi:hypothetical protein